MNKKRIAIFASGSGSNLQVLIDHSTQNRLGGGEVALVVSDRPASLAVERAKRASILVVALRPADFPDKISYETELLRALEREKIDWIVLAGYMRLVGSTLLHAYPSRIINLHPSLLPLFPGKDAIGQAWAAGVKYTGVTVHFVDEGMDTGPVIAQETVFIEQQDTLETLTEKIHVLEHELLPRVVTKLMGEDSIETSAPERLR